MVTERKGPATSSGERGVISTARTLNSYFPSAAAGGGVANGEVIVATTSPNPPS